MIIKITCPNCNSESGFSLANSSFKGPYRCWQCQENFVIEISDDKLRSCEPISQDEFDRLQKELAIKKKLEEK